MATIIMIRMSSMPKKRGMALIVVLVFAVVLVQLAISYSGMLRQSKPQTIIVDEKAKVDFLANGIIEKAILKYKLNTTYYYSALEAQKAGVNGPMLRYINDPILVEANYTGANSSFNSNPIGVFIATMTILTNSKWDHEAMKIVSQADYQDHQGNNVTKTIVRVISTDRFVKF